MNKICTSLEQSKRLIELGIDVNTADMYWLNRHIDLTETKYELFVVDRSNEYVDFFNSYAVAVDNNEIIHVWSLSALVELMPCKIIEEGETYILLITHGVIQYPMLSTLWPSLYDAKGDTLIDAAVEMIEWLSENNYLIKEAEK